MSNAHDPSFHTEGSAPNVARRNVLLGLGAVAAGAGLAAAVFKPASAPRYLHAALDIMQANALNRRKVDWRGARRAAFAEIRHAKTIADTYPAIRNALKRLNDGHSFFAEPDDMRRMKSSAAPAGASAPPSPRAQRLDSAFGYVAVPGFASLDATRNLAFAEQVQGLIRATDDASLKGWIVDLRTNTGGNMWPMLLGLSPLLGDGRLGSFVDADNQRSEWVLDKGAVANPLRQAGAFARGADNVILRLSGEPYRLRKEQPPVAVLTGPMTASSGEATCIAFRGRPRTASFGLPTYGVSTANQQFPLSDHAAIFLTTAVMADRTGRRYGSKVAPDHEVPAGDAPASLDTDATVRAATGWLDVQAAMAA